MTNCVPATRSCATCSTLLPVHSSSQPSATPRRQESHSPVHLESQLHRLAAGGRDARLPVQLSAPSSVYGYYTKFSVWLSIMRALSAAARIYHACAICCSSYVPCKCLLLLLSIVFVLSTIRMLPAAARIYRIRAICFCSYLPCVRYLLLLVSTIRMLPPAART